MRVFGVIAVLVAVSGCGVDGEPIRPSVGTVVSIGSNGTSVGTRVSGTKGNVTFGLGLGL